jgi:hypothetical protein
MNDINASCAECSPNIAFIIIKLHNLLNEKARKTEKKTHCSDSDLEGKEGASSNKQSRMHIFAVGSF